MRKGWRGLEVRRLPERDGQVYVAGRSSPPLARAPCAAHTTRQTRWPQFAPQLYQGQTRDSVTSSAHQRNPTKESKHLLQESDPKIRPRAATTPFPAENHSQPFLLARENHHRDTSGVKYPVHNFLATYSPTPPPTTTRRKLNRPPCRPRKARATSPRRPPRRSRTAPLA